MSLASGAPARSGALLAVMVALASCNSDTHMQPATAQAYLQELSGEQIKLAAAERRIPRRVSSPAALARAISMLAGAVQRLERDLAAITPPAPVRTLHARLVSISRAYALELRRAAHRARRPRDEPAAAQELSSATHSASGAFSGTVASITFKLRRSG